MRFGIDLGGTKTEIIALGNQGEELLRERVPTPSHDYAEIISCIADLVANAEQKLAHKTGGTQTKAPIGVGVPGAISPATGLIKNANTVCMIGKPFDRDLERAIGRPVRIANDANCLALSEATDGAGAGYDVVFAVILGTGTGGGIVVNQRLLTGPNAIAGEWGHNPLPWPTPEELPGPKCYCGKNGCIETFLSGPGLKRDHFDRTGDELTPKQIHDLALQGDTDAEETLRLYEDRLARALASVVNVLDPNAIVLAGGVSNLERLYVNVPRLLRKYVFSDRVDTRLLKARHGDSSGVRGAAWLWPQL